MRKDLEGTDTEAIKSSNEKLAQVSQKLGAALYAQQQAEGGTTAPGAEQQEAPQDDEVVDAEIIDDDKDTK